MSPPQSPTLSASIPLLTMTFPDDSPSELGPSGSEPPRHPSPSRSLVSFLSHDLTPSGASNTSLDLPPMSNLIPTPLLPAPRHNSQSDTHLAPSPVINEARALKMTHITPSSGPSATEHTIELSSVPARKNSVSFSNQNADIERDGEAASTPFTDVALDPPAPPVQSPRRRPWASIVPIRGFNHRRSASLPQTHRPPQPVSVSPELEPQTTPFSATSTLSSSATVVPETPRQPIHPIPEDGPFCQSPLPFTPGWPPKSPGFHGHGSDACPVECRSHGDVKKKRRSWVFIITLILSILSTVLSFLWMVVAFVQPRWGRVIASSSHAQMSPSTATFVCALLAKIIELSFVTVFVAVIGQILTYRAINNAGHITLAEMSVRNWVIQPGSMLTHFEALPRAAPTILGLLTISATLCATFYTTASEVMISPKLKFGDWESKNLTYLVRSSYANAEYARNTCATPLRTVDPGVSGTTGETNDGANTAGRSCLDTKYSGSSYRSYVSWLDEWATIHSVGTGTALGLENATLTPMQNRPVPKGMLYDNTTMSSQWIYQNYSDIATNYKIWDRVVNNVTLAMPHPGVYSAATSDANNILQPDDLSGIGEYMIKAAVVAPMLNVLCVDMTKDELTPLVWSLFTNQTVEPGSQALNLSTTFAADVAGPGINNYTTPTSVDAIFRWGANNTEIPGGTARSHAMFETLPEDFNAVLDKTSTTGDALYILTKPPVPSGSEYSNYTLCQLRSNLYLNCSTHFNISGTAGSHLDVVCDSASETNYHDGLGEDPKDPLYLSYSTDWHDLSSQWGLALDINSGLSDGNSSSARIWSQFNTITSPWRGTVLNPILPTIAEAFAVLASSTLIVGSMDSPLKHYWSYEATSLNPGIYEYFNATVRTQQYTSGNTTSWHKLFYLVLVTTVILNLCCFTYIVVHRGLITDYTEPSNMFALALNSPPSRLMAGACGGGPLKKQLEVPYRVQFQEGDEHFYFAEVPELYKGAPEKEVESRLADRYREVSTKRPLSMVSKLSRKDSGF